MENTKLCRSSASKNGHSDATSWSEKYGGRHGLQRVREFPQGIRPPQRVRIYARGERFLLQWWDPRERATLNERVNGDLVEAISRARDIDTRLEHSNSSGRKPQRCELTEVIDHYTADLQRRADAGEIDIGTVCRYEASLRRHFVPFVQQLAVSKKYPHAAKIDREFQLEFAAHMNHVQVSPNGHENSRRRPIKQPGFVLDVVRAMLEWASDPDRGNLLPDGFRNPFSSRKRGTRQVVIDPLSEPDITIPMATSLIEVCDPFQLSIFAPLLFYGLRPSELGWIFHENIEAEWLRVPCRADLDYFTKGRRDKSFPIVDCLRPLWDACSRSATGLLYVNRGVAEGRSNPDFLGWSADQLATEFRRRCVAIKGPDARQRRRIRDQVMKESGQLKYDHVEAEFKKLSSRLEWPAEATLKDLRHLFCTCLEDAAVPEFYRRYMMGQSFGKTPIVAYTHITESPVKTYYQVALESKFAPIVDAIEHRWQALNVKPTIIL
ncbi:MAG TPA: hypothetical protein QF564_05960 [Pirellulaceae bacterium]|nr:hypothetical protein [Pirellulaceae bacterium]